MITGQPVLQTAVVPGELVTFAVIATGDSLIYQWQKDGINILGSNSAIYTIAVVAVINEGAYQCIVSNAAGSATSAAASLTVCKCILC